MVKPSKHPELFDVITKVLLLAHGKAIVESGFSINKAMVDDNQHLETLAALQRTEDWLRHNGGVRNFKVAKDVLVSVSGARTRYEKDMKQRQSDDVVATKRKIDEQVQVISTKVKRLEDESHHLVEAAAKKALEAEKKENFKRWSNWHPYV